MLSFLSFCVSLSFLFCFSFSRCVLLFLLFVRFLMFVASLCPNFPTFRSISSFRCVVSSLFCRFVVRCVVLSFYRCIAPQVDEQSERMYQECVLTLLKSIKKVRTAFAAQKHENIEGIGPPWPWWSQGWAAVTSPRAQRIDETCVIWSTSQKAWKNRKTEKMTTQKWKVEKYVFCEMWHVFHQKTKGSTAGRLLVFYWKQAIKTS